ncbi:MAG: hypothetical protein KA099_01585 [Alphaproteobacteria bacterium]|nr:hypothetical protein [Alphaproteobacteria bacterium]MBP7758202.1 hypothetical protein [Alphaproteobacteria bacterium]MBP7761655.1 hypothetical protein [Alphaproteobacteria bacterium]MBP7903993.1 hypothetical protein [Alphaproteobacteria bacterium]
MLEFFNVFIGLVGGFGIGSLITTYVKENFDRKKFIYQEKSTVYAGYLESLSDVISEGSHTNRQKVVYWTHRIQLIAPKEIVDLAKSFFNEDSTKFFEIREKLVLEMTNDLNKTI